MKNVIFRAAVTAGGLWALVVAVGAGVKWGG